MNRYLLPILAAMLMAGCGQTSENGETADEAGNLVPQLQALEWILGDWRGMTERDEPFFEGYRVKNDSTIAIIYYVDSTFQAVTDSAELAVRSGQLVHQSAQSKWTLDTRDDLGWHFAPHNPADHPFIWHPVNKDNWQAFIVYPQPGGSARMSTYNMKRIEER